MRNSLKVATAIALTFSVVHADVAVAGSGVGAGDIAQDKDDPSGGQAAQRPQGELRRPSRGLCAGIGILVGGVLGAIFGGGRRGDGFNESAAILGGAGATLICGSVRWRSVHRRDQDEVNRRLATMTVDPNATSQTYASAATNRSYTMTLARETTYRTENAEYTTIQEVEPPPMGAKTSATIYRVTSTALNLRATPGTGAGDRITGAFYQGDAIESMSETSDGQWVLVGYQSVGYGWVARRFLEPVYAPRDTLVLAVPGQAPVPEAAPPVRPASGGRRARRAPAPSRPAQLVSAPPRRITATPPTRTATVQSQMPCRAATVTDNRRRSDQRSFCTGPGRFALL